MEYNPTWLILPVALAFALGWIFARFDRWQTNREPKEAPNAYFQGLTHLLNEQQDKAIDSFVEAVKLDPQTVELQFALGSLFRRRGEYERSVRVHQSLAERGDLKPAERERARYEMAADYLKAGLLDRAEQAYKPLADNAQGRYTSEALQALLNVAERCKDWPGAIAAAQKLEARGTASYSRYVAQYWCEIAEDNWPKNGDISAKAAKVTEALDAALVANKQCVRAVLLKGDLAEKLGDAHAAWEHWRSVEKLAPDYLPLAAQRATSLAQQADAKDKLQHTILTTLSRWKELSQSVDVLDAQLAWTSDATQRTALVDEHLQRSKTLGAAQRTLKYHPAMSQLQGELTSAVDQAMKTRNRFRCASCGFEARQYFWQCPGCVGWETFPPRRQEE